MNENYGTEINVDSSKPFAAMGYMAEDDLLIPESKMNQYEIGRAFYQLGKLHYDKSDLVQAEENFIKAYQCTERPRDTFSILKILGFLIRIASEKLEDDKATTYIAEAEVIVEEITQILGSLNAEYFYNVGTLKTYKGDFLDNGIVFK